MAGNFRSPLLLLRSALFVFFVFRHKFSLSRHPLGLIERRSALLANSYFAIATDFMPNPHRPAGCTNQLHLRNRHRPFLFSHAPFLLFPAPPFLLTTHHSLHLTFPLS